MALTVFRMGGGGGGVNSPACLEKIFLAPDLAFSHFPLVNQKTKTQINNFFLQQMSNVFTDSENPWGARSSDIHNMGLASKKISTYFEIFLYLWHGKNLKFGYIMNIEHSIIFSRRGTPKLYIPKMQKMKLILNL